MVILSSGTSFLLSPGHLDYESRTSIKALSSLFFFLYPKRHR
jgi:hypothetical protein